MADATHTEMLARLNVRLDDASNTTYTAAQKTEFLDTAYNDHYVGKVVRDISLTSILDTPNYTIPTGIEEIYDLLLDVDADSYPTELAREGYDIIDGTVYFNRKYKGLVAGKTIWIYGWKKLTTTDNLPLLVQDYVLELANIEALEWLKNKASTRFLKNDMTMSELMQNIATHKQRAGELRSRLANQRLITL